MNKNYSILIYICAPSKKRKCVLILLTNASTYYHTHARQLTIPQMLTLWQAFFLITLKIVENLAATHDPCIIICHLKKFVSHFLLDKCFPLVHP